MPLGKEENSKGGLSHINGRGDSPTESTVHIPLRESWADKGGGPSPRGGVRSRGRAKKSISRIIRKIGGQSGGEFKRVGNVIALEGAALENRTQPRHGQYAAITEVAGRVAGTQACKIREKRSVRV